MAQVFEGSERTQKSLFLWHGLLEMLGSWQSLRVLEVAVSFHLSPPLSTLQLSRNSGWVCKVCSDVSRSWSISNICEGKLVVEGNTGLNHIPYLANTLSAGQGSSILLLRCQTHFQLLARHESGSNCRSAPPLWDCNLYIRDIKKINKKWHVLFHTYFVVTTSSDINQTVQYRVAVVFKHFYVRDSSLYMYWASESHMKKMYSENSRSTSPCLLWCDVLWVCKSLIFINTVMKLCLELGEIQFEKYWRKYD